ncbi:MAG: GNAT family N-acetyltransferase [Alphaproteobacteria bacterium]
MELKLPAQIETPRLILKQHTLDKDYVQLWVDSINQNLAFLNRFLPHFDKPMTFEEEKSFLRMLMCAANEKNYAIWNKKTNELMGSTGAFNFEEKEGKKSAELGMLLFEKFSGKGYAPEATHALERALFEAGLDHTILKIDSNNTRSRRAAEKEGHLWDGKETATSRNHPNTQLLVYRKMKKNYE